MARIRVHDNRNATVTGVNYQDLRSILTAAELYRNDEARAALKKGDQEAIEWHKAQHSAIAEIRRALDDAILDTHTRPRRGT